MNNDYAWEGWRLGSWKLFLTACDYYFLNIKYINDFLIIVLKIREIRNKLVFMLECLNLGSKGRILFNYLVLWYGIMKGRDIHDPFKDSQND